MRLQDLPKAQTYIEEVLSTSKNERVIHYAKLTLSRIETRRHEFDSAKCHWQQALETPVSPEDWLCGYASMAKAEWHLERDESEPARTAFTKALKTLPDWAIEERVQALQSLAFLASSELNVKSALRYFQSAANLLEVAQAWAELVPMKLTTASLLIARGRTKEAVVLFKQAHQICVERGFDQWRTPVEVGLARALGATESRKDAKKNIMEMAKQCAGRGDFSGFISMILLLAGVDTDYKDYESAYRTLVVGQSISKHLKLPTAASVFRAQINHLKHEVMGVSKFDTMVEEMLKRARASELH